MHKTNFFMFHEFERLKRNAIVWLTRNASQYWDWIPLESSCNQFSFDTFSYSMRLDVRIYSITCANYSSLARVKTWREYAVYFPNLVFSFNWIHKLVVIWSEGKKSNINLKGSSNDLKYCSCSSLGVW